MSGCVFCQIVAGGLPGSFVYRDEIVSAFLDILPVTPGHVLVVPNEHVASVRDLPGAMANRLFAVARRLAETLREAEDVRADGVTLHVADGEAAGQDVPHAHMHVIPRFPGDGFHVDAAAWRAPPPFREELDGIAATLSSAANSTLAPASAPTFPDVTLETSRLILRAHRAEDARDVALACRDELIQRWLPLPTPYTEADALAWCTERSPRLQASGEGIELGAVRRSDGRLIGSFGLKRTDWRGRSSEIGYWVAPWARGEGLAVEAVGVIARWLLLDQGFERLELRAASGNLASQRVAEKAGFLREGVSRNAGFTHDGRVDLVVFSLVRSDVES